MIDIEQAVGDKFPAINLQPPIIRKPTISLLRKLAHEKDINAFLQQHADKSPIDFIDSVFEYFNFSYSVSQRDLANIPDCGRLVIVANHPIGSLDGLALLRMIYSVRQDVKILANDMLMHFEQLHPLFIAADNMKGGKTLTTFREALRCLESEGAIILFPAGEVSRVRPSGVRDTRWQPGFLKMARRTGAPLLPVHIRAKNSLWFYSASLLFKPLGTALLAKEMFRKHNGRLDFCVGEPIPAASLVSDAIADKALIRRLKKHLYKLGGRSHKPEFVTEKTIAHPEDRRLLLKEVQSMTRLGVSKDGHEILLTHYHQSPSMMKELGRLREVTFRRVGEGTGSKRDLDDFDICYQHLLLWNPTSLDVVGAYRLGATADMISSSGEISLYTRTLFHFSPAMSFYLESGLELGRSFVVPQYWGKNSLDYLWQGIGAYLRQRTDIRYLIGPVTISARLPDHLVEQLIYYYQTFYGSEQQLARSRKPFSIAAARLAELQQEYAAHDREAGFKHLQAVFHECGCKVPVLFKQYAALFEEGGFQLLSFSVDPDFSDCIDGLFIADLQTMKEKRKQRYLGIPAARH